jgi:hypothetical protein
MTCGSEPVGSTALALRHCWAVAAALVVAACNNGDFISPGVSGSVVTVVDSGPALSSAVTFALPDTIVELPVGRTTLSHASDSLIIASIRQQLLAMGWQDVGTNPTPRPDVVVLVAAQTRIQTGVFYTDWFGGWGYLPYWDPFVGASWGWGAPAGAIPYEFPAGTLLIAMLDLRAQNEARQSIPMLWAAAIDGVLSNVTATTERALFGVDQAFKQSQYLERDSP